MARYNLLDNKNAATCDVYHGKPVSLNQKRCEFFYNSATKTSTKTSD